MNLKVFFLINWIKLSKTVKSTKKKLMNKLKRLKLKRETKLKMFIICILLIETVNLKVIFTMLMSTRSEKSNSG